MTGLLWAELRRFGERPAIWWIAAGMLVHVGLTVSMAAFDEDSSTLAELLEQGQLSDYSMLLVVLACVAGVLLVTGEAASGGTRSLLTVEPRRGRVYWSKLVAAGLAVIPGVAGAYALLAIGLYWVHARVELLGGPSSELMLSLASSGGRSLALAACAAVCGASIGVLVRRWWVAVVLVVAWYLVWVLDTQTILSGVAPFVREALLLPGITAVLAVLGWVVFGRRDVR